jgi:hypothetical protein
MGDLCHASARSSSARSMGKRQASKDRELIERAPLVAVLGTDTDSRATGSPSTKSTKLRPTSSCGSAPRVSPLVPPPTIEVAKLRPARLQRSGAERASRSSCCGSATPASKVRRGDAQPRRSVQPAVASAALFGYAVVQMLQPGNATASLRRPRRVLLDRGAPVGLGCGRKAARSLRLDRCGDRAVRHCRRALRPSNLRVGPSGGPPLKYSR